MDINKRDQILNLLADIKDRLEILDTALLCHWSHTETIQQWKYINTYVQVIGDKLKENSGK